VSALTDEKDALYTGANSLGPLMSVMLDDYGTMWAQLGWLYHKYPGGTIAREIFVEHVDGFGNNSWDFWAGMPVGTTTTYMITYDPSIGRFNYYVNGSSYAGLNSNTAYRPARWEIFGETHDAADQTPGGTSIHARFRSAQVRLYGSSTWSAANGTVHSMGQPDNEASGSSGSFDIWDWQCAS
jgi:hypothetical protein